MALLPLDLTARLSSNLITETHVISRDIDRFFIPKSGAFYGEGFKIYNLANGQLLKPNTEYRLLHLVEEASKISYKNVYAVVYIIDKNLTNVQLSYQAIGGVYQNISSVIDQQLSNYLQGTANTGIYGSIVGVPEQFPPEHHLQHSADFTGMGATLAILERIRQAMLMGNGAAFAATYQYIIDVMQDALGPINERIRDVIAYAEQIEQRTQIQNGDYKITSNPANPSSYLGYGNWVLDTNVLLYGAVTNDDVGDLIDVGTSVENNLVAIKRFFWRRDDSAAGATYVLTANKANVNEGETVRINLTTSGLSIGTKIAYKITGINEGDLVNGSLYGQFETTASGAAVLDLNIKQDMLTEGVEVIRVSLVAMPAVYVDVTVNDTSLAPTVAIKFSSSPTGVGELSSVNEGDTVYAILSTEGMAIGTVLYLLYNDSTVSNADSNTDEWPTLVTVDEADIISVPFTIKSDNINEGAETLVVNVCGTNSINTRIVRGVITVNDTSRAPSANITYAGNTAGTNIIRTVNEGSTFYAVINTENIEDGTLLDIAYTGTASAGDFSGELTRSIMVIDNTAIISFNLNNDIATEGDETFTTNIYLAGTKITESTIIIKDTSTNPTFNLRFSNNTSGTDVANTVNEGSTVYLVLTTTNIPNGKVYQLEYSGTSTANDFNNQLANTLTVSDNIANVAFTLKPDMLTEQSETLIVTLKDGNSVVGTATININDTSTAPTVNVRFSSNTAGTNTIVTANEGQTIHVFLETINIPNGDTLTLEHGGTTVVEDFATELPESVIVENNRASYSFILSNDLSFEGEETYNVKVTMTTGDTVTSNNLRVVDTSTPLMQIYFSGNDTGVGQITTANEGDTIYLVVETQGVDINTEVSANLTYTGTVGDNDISGERLTKVDINSNRLIVPYTIANDARTDGVKDMSVTVTIDDMSLTKTATIIINDTSLFNRLTESQNLVVPRGKFVRGFLISPPAISGNNDLTPLVSSIKINDKTYSIANNFNGGTYVFTGENNSGGLNGQDGLSNITLTEDKYFGNYIDTDSLNTDYTVINSDVINDGGLLTLIRIPGIGSANDTAFPGVQIGGLATTLSRAINLDTANYIGTGVIDSITGNMVYPGRVGGNNIMAFVYYNNTNDAISLPIVLGKHGPEVTGSIGVQSSLIYEIHDTYEESKLAMAPVKVFDCLDESSSTTKVVTLLAGRKYHVTAVAGGGSNDSSLIRTSQSVALSFSNSNTVYRVLDGNNVEVSDITDIVTGVVPNYIKTLKWSLSDSPVEKNKLRLFSAVPSPYVIDNKNVILKYGKGGVIDDTSRGGTTVSFVVDNIVGTTLTMTIQFDNPISGSFVPGKTTDPYGNAIDPGVGLGAAVFISEIVD